MTMKDRFSFDPGPDAPGIVRTIVEIPKNSSNKYEFDSSLGVFKVSRTLYSPIHYYDSIATIDGIPPHSRREIEHFFSSIKNSKERKRRWKAGGAGMRRMRRLSKAAPGPCGRGIQSPSDRIER
jgi:inorganic pyrophosphatase